MKPPPEETRPDRDEPPSGSTAQDEARRIIEAYADDLREIIKKFRRKLN